MVSFAAAPWRFLSSYNYSQRGEEMQHQRREGKIFPLPGQRRNLCSQPGQEEPSGWGPRPRDITPSCSMMQTWRAERGQCGMRASRGLMHLLSSPAAGKQEPWGVKPQFPSPPAAAHVLDAPLFTPEQKPHAGHFTINAIPLVTPRSHQCSPEMELPWLINALV